MYVVNRRTVVDQSTEEAKKLRDNLAKAPEIQAKVGSLAISTLRGQFADNREWSADPARPAVIVGTVDMIGSRLLFSGYGVGFKAKPLHAGFLGQDVLLVHDEAHLNDVVFLLPDGSVPTALLPRPDRRRRARMAAFALAGVPGSRRGSSEPLARSPIPRLCSPGPLLVGAIAPCVYRGSGRSTGEIEVPLVRSRQCDGQSGEILVRRAGGEHCRLPHREGRSPHVPERGSRPLPLPLPDSDCPAPEVLTAAARSITHLGWGIDMVAANAEVISEADADKLPGERWRPVEGSSAAGYRVPIPGTLEGLIQKHQAFLTRLGPEGFRPVPPLSAFRVVGYRRATDPSARRFAGFRLLHPVLERNAWFSPTRAESALPP